MRKLLTFYVSRVFYILFEDLYGVTEHFRCQKQSANQEILLKNLKDEIEALKAHTTPKPPSSSSSNEFLTFQPKSEKFTKALCMNISNKPSQSVVIKGTQPAEVGEFPYHVALGYNSSYYGNETEYNCGGSLIADDIILTAAHCVYRNQNRPVTVKLGRVCL